MFREIPGRKPYLSVIGFLISNFFFKPPRTNVTVGMNLF